MQSSGAGIDNNKVVTLTTPTITPTIMRNIEQFILDFAHTSSSHEEMGSFIPPLPLCYNVVSSSNCAYGSVRSELDTPYVDAKSLKSSKTATKNMGKNIQYLGGKRPKIGKNINPQEEERRRLKRERNKLAAAKCRKRRVDHCKTLEEETENLESKKGQLQGVIAKLQEEKEQLEFILRTHKPLCVKSKKEDIKRSARGKPARPTSLPLNPAKQESLTTPNGNKTPDWRSCFVTGFTPGSSPVITPTAANMLTLFGMVTYGGKTETQCEMQIQPRPGKI